jgi:hypothetical protein
MASTDNSYIEFEENAHQTIVENSMPSETHIGGRYRHNFCRVHRTHHTHKKRVQRSRRNRRTRRHKK